MRRRYWFCELFVSDRAVCTVQVTACICHHRTRLASTSVHVPHWSTLHPQIRGCRGRSLLPIILYPLGHAVLFCRSAEVSPARWTTEAFDSLNSRTFAMAANYQDLHTVSTFVLDSSKVNDNQLWRYRDVAKLLALRANADAVGQSLDDVPVVSTLHIALRKLSVGG